jgi:hypothetical protein
MSLTMMRQGYKASTILASQNVMKFLILNADGNVTIQTKNYPHPNDPDGVTEEVRLYCDKCQASKTYSCSVRRASTTKNPAHSARKKLSNWTRRYAL